MSTFPSSHNERIAAKRHKAHLEFLNTTSTNLPTARYHLQQNGYDVERAVSSFYDSGGEALPSDDEGDGDGEEETITTAPNNVSEGGGDGGGGGGEEEEEDDNDPVSKIMKLAKEATPTTGGREEEEQRLGSFGGRGFSLRSDNDNNNDNNTKNNDNDKAPELQIQITFYRNGFTTQERPPPPSSTSTSTAPPPPRRRGIHSLSSAPSPSSTTTPLLPPLRPYHTHTTFLRDVEQSRVPSEFRRVDADSGRPVKVSFWLDDGMRGREYPVEVWLRQEGERREGRKGGFGGVGHALGGGGGGGGKDVSKRGRGGGGSDSATGSGGGGILTTLLAYIIAVAVWLYGRLRLSMSYLPLLPGGGGGSGGNTAVVLERHTVDSARPTTYISLRLPIPSSSSSSSSSRTKVQFNTNHTVGDLRQYCQLELYQHHQHQQQLLQRIDRSSSEGTRGTMPPPPVVEDFQLLAGFPPRIIQDDGLSLEEAGLLNSAVDVRLVS